MLCLSTAGEQTWPTEEELSAAAAAAASRRGMRKRRLPAGTSEYQAAWILDSDDDGSEGSEDELEGELHRKGPCTFSACGDASSCLIVWGGG